MEYKNAVRMEKNIANDMETIEIVLRTHEDAISAMYREEVEYIDFVYDEEGNAVKKYAGAMELRKFLQIMA